MRLKGVIVKIIHDEILFKNRAEAEKYHDLLVEKDMVIYSCSMCGIHFGSDDPYTWDFGIIDRVCMKATNLHEDDNYRPDYLEPVDDFVNELDMDMFDPYDDNKNYGGDTWE